MKFIAAILFMVIAVDVSSKVSKLDSGGYMNIYCVNGYVVIVKGEGGVTQMYRPSPDGTNPPQPMVSPSLMCATASFALRILGFTGSSPWICRTTYYIYIPPLI